MTTTCSATIGQKPGPYGFIPIRCGQTVGIRLYVTTGGIRIGYCAKEGHEANVRRRFPERADPPEPLWLHEQLAHEAHGGDENPDRESCRICQAALNDFIRYGAVVDPPEYTDDMTYAKWFEERLR